MPGGISTKVLTAAEIETVTYDHASLTKAGSGVGSGGMVVIGEGTCMVRLLQVLLRFYHHESCGQCTPCREGMGWMHRIIDRIVAGEGRPEDIDQLIRISKANDGTTICGMGDAAGYATVGIIAKYRDEFEYFIEHKRSRLDGRLEVAGPKGRVCMIEFFINGQPVQAEDDQTVMQAAKANGYFIPYFCWHPQLSVPGNCRICMVEVSNEGQPEGSGWLDIACNMPITKGMRVLTDSEKVRARRKETLQFITLNHPVDCGICDKAGECTLQDYHYEYNGSPSISRDAKVHATKHFALSERIVLDNERCILCTRCVRFTREVSKTHALGVQNRGDHSLIRPVEDGAFENDPYSDNVIDICPVGALLSRPFLHKARVWYLKATPSVCPGCERGCSVNIWHRKSEWKLKALDPAAERAHRPRHAAREPGRQRPVDLQQGARPGADLRARACRAGRCRRAGRSSCRRRSASARALIQAARRPVALVSNWASNEELAAFNAALGAALQLLRQDRLAARTGRAGRGRSADQARQEPEQRRGARALPRPARRCRAAPSRPTPTWCWSGARVSASRSCRRTRRSSTSTAGCSPRTAMPTCSCRSA